MKKTKKRTFVSTKEMKDKEQKRKNTNTRRFSNSGIKEAPKLKKLLSLFSFLFYVALAKLCLEFLKIPHFFSGYLTEFIFTLNMYFVFYFFYIYVG